MPLPNLWKDYFNLKSSPYFQTPLQKGSATKSLDMFVGREREKLQLLTAIGSSDSSRQAVAGRPGVGKTTLVQVVKNKASKEGYWVADDLIPVTTESSGMLLGQLLAGVYDAVNSNSASCGGDTHPAVTEAQPLVRIARLQLGNTSMNVSGLVLGLRLGASDSSSETISIPPDALILDGPRVLRNLLDYALENKAEGVLLHLNNLENLSDVDEKKAADRLRDIRDQALMLDGLHLIIVGTTSAILSTVNRYTQIKSVFSPPMILEELTLPDVYELLNKRYEALQNEPGKLYKKPIEDSTLEVLYKLFHGNLRGMLRSLEYGIQTLLSSCDTSDDVTFPITLQKILSVLKKPNQEELKEDLGSTNWNRILTWSEKVADPDSTQTQTTLSEIWGVNQVSTIMKTLIDAEAVEALPERHGREIQYRLTGKARLATSEHRERSEA